MKPQVETRKKSEFQMGFEPTTFRDLDGRENLILALKIGKVNTSGYQRAFRIQLNLIYRK